MHAFILKWFNFKKKNACIPNFVTVKITKFISGNKVITSNLNKGTLFIYSSLYQLCLNMLVCITSMSIPLYTTAIIHRSLLITRVGPTSDIK